MMSEKIKAALISLFVLLPLVSCAAPVQLAQAPAFTLNDMTGHQVSLSEYKGQKAVLLLFFNPKTGGGQDTLLREYLDYYRPTDKLQIIPIVDISEPSAENAAGSTQKRLTDLGYPVPLRDEDGSVSQAFRANSDKLTLVLVDREGRIRFREEVTSTADTNAELAEQIKQATK